VVALFENMQANALHQPNLATPILNVFFSLSSVDPRLWMTTVKSEFERIFYGLAVECPHDSIRDCAWNSLKEFFAKTCQAAFRTTNGVNGNASDSDVDSKMEIDQPDEKKDIVKFLWEVMMQCLKKSTNHIPYAAKAFETGAIMLRFVLRCCTNCSAYYKALDPTQPDDASELLNNVGDIAREQLLAHEVEENVLSPDVDNVTLGWTRMLQAVLDLVTSDDIDALIPRYGPPLQANSSGFSTKIIESFLFPALPGDNDTKTMRPYCVQSETRSALFDLVFKLANTQRKRSVIAMFLYQILDDSITLQFLTNFRCRMHSGRALYRSKSMDPSPFTSYGNPKSLEYVLHEFSHESIVHEPRLS
jgi:hypothetical protein